jgi:hypothetical protein
VKTLLLVYMVVYAVVWVAIYFAEGLVVPPAERDSVWELLLDVVLLATGFVGMALYLKDIDHTHLKLAWKFVAPVLLGGHLWGFIRHMRERPRLIADSGGVSPEGDAAWIELATTVLLLPSLVINLAFGYL